mgnify:CR=1 FL=1
MSAYQTPAEILNWLSFHPSSIAVIVEGESRQDDPRFYTHWFGDRATEVQFFPQDGCGRVEEAVLELRRMLNPKRVYGIIDRDFAPLAVYPPLPTDGIVRTRQYTLENYLLEAECWAVCARRYMGREAAPEWNDCNALERHIVALYRRCLPVSAYNWVLRQARQIDDRAFERLPSGSRQYKEGPEALDALARNVGDVSSYLRTIQTQMGITENLGVMYQERLTWLEQQNLAEWQAVVSGKYVLNLFRQSFPMNIAEKDWKTYVLGAYLEECLDPPVDLQTLVEAILADAHA